MALLWSSGSRDHEWFTLVTAEPGRGLLCECAWVSDKRESHWSKLSTGPFASTTCIPDSAWWWLGPCPYEALSKPKAQWSWQPKRSIDRGSPWSPLTQRKGSSPTPTFVNFIHPSSWLIFLERSLNNIHPVFIYWAPSVPQAPCYAPGIQPQEHK